MHSCVSAVAWAWARRCSDPPLFDLSCILTLRVSIGWMVDWLAARAMAPATTSVAGLSPDEGDEAAGAAAGSALLCFPCSIRGVGWCPDQKKSSATVFALVKYLMMAEFRR